ncbi:hypothetical protein, partial [Bradyrhizobium macuxiense]
RPPVSPICVSTAPPVWSRRSRWRARRDRRAERSAACSASSRGA